jgi:hypothetical protein
MERVDQLGASLGYRIADLTRRLNHSNSFLRALIDRRLSSIEQSLF